jgi:hypothetical protein
VCVLYVYQCTKNRIEPNNYTRKRRCIPLLPYHRFRRAKSYNQRPSASNACTHNQPTYALPTHVPGLFPPSHQITPTTRETYADFSRELELSCIGTGLSLLTSAERGLRRLSKGCVGTGKGICRRMYDRWEKNVRSGGHASRSERRLVSRCAAIFLGTYQDGGFGEVGHSYPGE